MEERHVVSPNGSTYYWISKPANAQDRAIVFLHGLTADHRLFDRQVEDFTAEYTVVAWDAPGHGKSRPYADFSYANLAEELKTILDAQSIRHVVLAGQSMGGFVAQSFLSRYPLAVKGFIAIDTCPYGTAYYSKSDFFWLRQTEWMFRCFPDKLLRGTMARMCGSTPYARAHMQTMLQAYTKDELCRLMYIGFAGFIPEVHDLAIPCPVTLILGANDRTGRVRRYNRRWHEAQGYPLHVIANASHNANEDAPAQVNSILHDFLREIGWHA